VGCAGAGTECRVAGKGAVRVVAGRVLLLARTPFTQHRCRAFVTRVEQETVGRSLEPPGSLAEHISVGGEERKQWPHWSRSTP
jgi:hypothetical protein